MVTTVNGWYIHDPKWEELRRNPKVRWKGMFISQHRFSGSSDRLMASYPDTAEHFYYVWQYYALCGDCIFASYSRDEVIRFIKEKMKSLLEYGARHNTWAARVHDAVTGEVYSLDEFLNMEKYGIEVS